MKKIWLMIFGLATVTLANAQVPVSLTQAWQKQQVEASFAGNDKSVHYLKPLIIKLKNLQKTALSISLEAGAYFVSQPADYQDIITTEDLLVNLQPNETKTLEVYGVCTEASNSAPRASTSYTPAPSPQ
ncbi:MAG: hypothetical protein MUE85_09775 [Microscillaceae bacterium]|jgi:hypothetical protein|nr:hypothetical protein [Microscillaceae bacterium]